MDRNGWVTYTDCKISKAGVFPYRGASVGHGEDPNEIIKVYRPFSEMSKAAKSFENIPVLDGHEMIGKDTAANSQNTPYDRRRADGVLFNVRAEDGAYFGDLKIWSENLIKKIDGGQKELSLGYYCKFEPASGTYENDDFSYIQKDLCGNHIASVRRARCGGDVKVQDGDDMKEGENLVMDSFDLEISGSSEAEDEFVDFRDIEKAVASSDLSAEQKESLMKKLSKSKYERNTKQAHEDKKKREISMPVGDGDLNKTKGEDMADNEKIKTACDEDKRKQIDEIGGMLKGKIDEELWRTVMKKAEDLAYKASETSKADDGDEDPKKEQKSDDNKAGDEGEKEDEKSDKEKKTEKEGEKAQDSAEELLKKVSEVVKSEVKSAMDSFEEKFQKSQRKGITPWMPAQDSADTGGDDKAFKEIFGK